MTSKTTVSPIVRSVEIKQPSKDSIQNAISVETVTESLQTGFARHAREQAELDAGTIQAAPPIPTYIGDTKSLRDRFIGIILLNAEQHPTDSTPNLKKIAAVIHENELVNLWSIAGKKGNLSLSEAIAPMRQIIEDSAYLASKYLEQKQIGSTQDKPYADAICEAQKAGYPERGEKITGVSR